MGKLGLAVAIAVAAVVACPAAAFARDLPAGGVTRQEVLQWLQKHGMKAKIEYDDVAKDSTVAAASNSVNWAFYFYSCKGERCRSLQYAAGWSNAKQTATQVNEWNHNRRFLRAYKTDANMLFAEYDLDVTPGGTWELLDASLDRWTSQLAVFEKFRKSGTVPTGD